MSEQDGQALDEQLAAEQVAVGEMYTELDRLRELTAAELAGVRREVVTGNHQGRSERDAFARLHEDRLRQLWSVEDRLVFGRLDMADGERQYVGRLGLSGAGEGRLLIDWRAPAATPFYQATAAAPAGTARRRHLGVLNREVTSIEDDVLDLAATQRLGLTDLRGEGALMAAVSAQRTGRMNDIVATIQAEQDRIIRDVPEGILVVQGGPGTGKTAVALHRAAFLLYDQRERLTKSGVLVIGPSPIFLRYIEHVLPALGETGVVMMSAGELVPGVRATRHDEGRTAALKADLRMVDVMRRAVAFYQRVPDEPVVIKYEGHRIVLRPKTIAIAVHNAQRSGRLHNQARETFVKSLLGSLIESLGRVTRTNYEGPERAEMMVELRRDDDIRTIMNRLWLPLTPQRVLRGLFALPARLDAATPDWSEADRMALWRDVEEDFTVEDVPLLDEIAELIGETPSATTGTGQAMDADYAQGVLDMLGANSMVTASQLMDRFAEGGANLTLSERAAADRTWAYGHLVVDEAQELSPMMWRALLRRVPSKSVTAVGDLAQSRSVAGARSWAGVFEEHVGDRLRVRQLTVNYRTPAQIMAVANRVAAAAGLELLPNESVREGDWPPVITQTDDLGNALPAVVAQEREFLGAGRLAVICPPELLVEVADVVRSSCGADEVGVGDMAVDQPVAVMTPAQSKGLEFDGVVLVEPALIANHPVAGPGDVYVAMTRATQRLHVVYTTDLPPGLATD